MQTFRNLGVYELETKLPINPRPRDRLVKVAIAHCFNDTLLCVRTRNISSFDSEWILRTKLSNIKVNLNIYKFVNIKSSYLLCTREIGKKLPGTVEKSPRY